MNGSRRSGPGCPVSAGFAVEGLPPLPKGLSGILNSSGGSWRDIEKVHSKRARIQADISRGGGGAPRGHGKPGGLAAALALLRKEMPLSSSSLSLPPPSSNSRDQWIKDSFHIP
ncbi:Protein FAM89A [Liparis tanakae]|uniref:Protein FAM89A n=1 Tax=Liparis tanakae TaxID=230148 RepID=A0A4Z2HF79_9TELE|nr:Protein FAM89A [Liparis tanakae]